MRHASKTVLLSSALLLSSTAAVDAQPLGPAFRVNGVTTGQQLSPATAPIGSTGFVVVWTGEDGSYDGVFARRFDLSGNPIGAQFRVNSATTGNQASSSYGGPAVSSDPAGNFVVVWASGGASAEKGIYAQRYTSSGAPIGGEFQVNASTTVTARNPDVSVAPAGAFVVAWDTLNLTGADKEVHARRFSSTGTPVDDQFKVNSYTTGDQSAPHVAASTSTFVVVWASDGQPPDDSTGVFAQRYEGSGAPLGGEFHVNVYTTGFQDLADVSGRPDGSFVVVWRSGSDSDGDGDGIRGRTYDSAGAPTGLFFANTYTTGSQTISAVAHDALGYFLVTWNGTGPEGASDIFARRFSPLGNPTGPQFTLLSEPESFSAPDVAWSPAGRALVVAYKALPSNDYDVYGRLFCVKGDVNLDGNVAVNDVFILINFLFAAGATPPGCGDVNADGMVDVLDVFHLINFLFAAGAPPI
jgi:hypothetical protein